MKNIYNQFQPIGKTWLMDLDNYNEVPFQRKTSKVKWSLGEIYEHLCTSTLEFHLKGVEKCLSSPKTGNKTWTGKMVFLKGSFDNKKLKKYMEEGFTPKQPEDIAKAKDVIIRVLKQMDEYGARITKENVNQKAEHPILGYLTAQEWYKLAIYHFEYHEKNKLKIKHLLAR
jgi:hypothetical protein